LNRRRGCLWFAAGLILAVLAGTLAFITVQKAASTPKQVEEVPRVKVVVAARDISLHTVITDADLALREEPADVVPDGALTAQEDAVGKLSTVNIARGEIVLPGKLIAPDYVGPQTALVMDPKQVVIAFPATDLLSSVDVVRPGDRVEILFSHDFGKDPSLKKSTGMNTLTILQNVRVAGIIYDSKDPKTGSHGPAKAILLAVDPQDALVLKYLRDSGASQDLALRSPAATGEFNVSPVNGEYMLQRYKIQWQAGQ